MKKPSRKQMMTGGAIAFLLIGGGTTIGLISHNNESHEEQKEKAEKLEKAKEAKVEELLEKASASPSNEIIKRVTEAITQLKDEKIKSKNLESVKDITIRLDSITKAQNALKDFQAHETDAAKQKFAQEAINTLKDKDDVNIKADLQKQFDTTLSKVKAQRQVEETKKSQQTQSS